MVNVFVKNVDDGAYRLAKVIAAREDKPIGRVVSESILLLAQRARKKGLAAVKPVDFGPGTEKLSQSIDEILYGD
ncbi:MAG: hypothetical protein AABW54_03840 [Candidatus Micrarchaeota archaeon]